MHSLKLFFFSAFLFFQLTLPAADYKFEGLFKEPDGEKRLFLTTFFLPYNPSIVAYSPNPEVANQCAHWWAKASFTFGDRAFSLRNYKCDFLWIDDEKSELQILQEIVDELNQVSVIYTTTHFSRDAFHYKHLKNFLEKNNFCLLSHWYWEGEKGNAIFIRKDIFDAAMRSLNYSPSRFQLPSNPKSYEIEQFLRKAENKSLTSTLEQIDYIYMINLDERPEKFAQAAGALHSFGIYPYRFSAVNGWKLPGEVLSQVGVRFLSETPGEKFMGTIYKEVDGQEYISNEIIKQNEKCYFQLGMSRGSIGIVLSHLSVLKDAYDSGYNTIWVMEDDVEAVDNPRQIPELIRKLDRLVDEWDILFTDLDTKNTEGRHVECRALAARPNFNMEPLHIFLSRFYPISTDFSRMGMRYGAYSMIVRRSGMKKILDHFNSYGIFLPYDMDFWLIPNLKMYRVNKDIVSHKVGSPTDNHEPGYDAKNRH